MQRTNIYLDEAQTSALDQLAKREGVSRAELVRRFVDQGLSARTADVDADLAAIEASFGVLGERVELPVRGTSGRDAYLEALRAR
ncbi:MAG: CopG family transcriptional regulator [Sporichthyaceae bacterium]